MIIGSDEWVKEQCLYLSEKACPELEYIANQAAKRHGVDKLTISHMDATRVALVLSETQNQSFILGVQMGIDVCRKVIQDFTK